MGRILAIDYGTKRTGLAVTDPSRTIATALETIPTHTAIAYLEAYFRKESVDVIVIGEPKRLNNSDSETTFLSHKFAQQVSAAFPHHTIVRYDERFTSLMAQRSLLESGQSRKVRRDKSVLDSVSATILLQSYLESEQSSPL